MKQQAYRSEVKSKLSTKLKIIFKKKNTILTILNILQVSEEGIST